MHSKSGIKDYDKHLHEVKALCFGNGARCSNACGIQPTNQPEHELVLEQMESIVTSCWSYNGSTLREWNLNHLIERFPLPIR